MFYHNRWRAGVPQTKMIVDKVKIIVDKGLYGMKKGYYPHPQKERPIEKRGLKLWKKLKL
jgi:hypothetical protein